MAYYKKYAIIRNQDSGLVLDATDYVVKLQHYTGFDAQLWQLQLAGPGTFFVENKLNGKVLDIQGSAKHGNNLITYAKHGGLNQQWFINSDKTIVSAADDELAIDMCKGSLRAGTELIAFKKQGNLNQKFLFQCR